MGGGGGERDNFPLPGLVGAAENAFTSPANHFTPIS